MPQVRVSRFDRMTEPGLGTYETGSHSTEYKPCDDTLSVAVENTGRLGRHLGLGFSYLGKSACAEHWPGTVQRGSVCSHSLHRCATRIMDVA